MQIIWLASYPKSGNTWMRILLGHYFADKTETIHNGFVRVGTISSHRPSFDELTGLASSDLIHSEIDLLRPDFYRALSQLASNDPFIKAHDSYHKNNLDEWIFPADCSKGVIYIVRHPFDVAVSLTHHWGNKNYMKAVKFMIDSNAFLSGKGRSHQIRQLTQSWSQHYKSWTQQTDIPVLIVRYEDMLANTAKEFTRVLEFLNHPNINELDIKKVINATQFQKLRQLEDNEGFMERHEKSDRFFRSGRSGEGLEKLPKKLQEDIIKKHSAVMEELGYI